MIAAGDVLVDYVREEELLYIGLISTEDINIWSIEKDTLHPFI